MHARGSYFISPPPSPNATASVAHSPGRSSYFSSTPSTTAQAAHPTAIRSPAPVSGHGYTTSPRSSPRLASHIEGSRHSPPRRPTLTSAIPIGIQQSIVQQSSDSRRRPSFKIDIPPRPAPTELLADVPTGPAEHTPYAVECAETKMTPHDERGAGRRLSTGALDMTDMRAEIDNIVYRAHAANSAPSIPQVRSPMPATSFRNPFAPSLPPIRSALQQPAGFMILTGPSGRIDEAVQVESPACEHDDALAGGAGLGYSLNRMRAPTPWARTKEQEGEWLTEEDVLRVSQQRPDV